MLLFSLKNVRAISIWLFLCLGLSWILGCDKISIPRLSFETPPHTRLPIAVVYEFEPELAASTEIVDACGLPHTVQVGDIITQSFLSVGQEHFASVMTHPETSGPDRGSAGKDVTIKVRLIQFALDPIGRSGEEDRYDADVDLQLEATYLDAQGHPLAKTPLTYHDRVRLWTPSLSSQSGSCATGQFDGVVEDAADFLAQEMVSVVPQLFGQAPQPPGSVVQAPLNAPPGRPAQAHTPSVEFRTKLQDQNDDLVLEGGEGLVLQVETTNVSAMAIPSANVELQGTPAIMEAFTHVTSLPVAIGSLQPGETRTTEIRGRMPPDVQVERGELRVSISLSQGVPPGPHRILAAIRPGRGSGGATGGAVVKKDVRSAPPDAEETVRNASRRAYYALIIGMDEYRDPWPQAFRIDRPRLQALADALKATGTFAPDGVKVLDGRHATRTDIEEAIVALARRDLSAESVLLVYFAGHALADKKQGLVYLVPYEGSPHAGKNRLISLRRLQAVLGTLKIKLSMILLDTPVVQYWRSERLVGLNGSTPLQWGGNIQEANSTRSSFVVQVRNLSGRNVGDPVRLLSGLLGRADQNRDGIITVEEFLKDLEKTAEIIPPRLKDSSIGRLPLAR